MLLLLLVEGADFRSRRIEITVDSTAEIDSIFCTEVEIYKLIVDDEVVENDENFQLRAVYPEELIGAADTLGITIQDNDGEALIGAADTLDIFIPSRIVMVNNTEYMTYIQQIRSLVGA